MSSKRSSGLDFSDGQSPMLQLQQHPDLAIPYGTGLQPGHLHRNKTERRRLQGLQRSNTVGSVTQPALNKAKTFKQRFDVWMINEGGRQLFFGVWVVLHLLVAVFGFFNYQLKDNNVDARATFGVTYGSYIPLF
jgi:NADPH oxidase